MVITQPFLPTTVEPEMLIARIGMVERSSSPAPETVSLLALSLTMTILVVAWTRRPGTSGFSVVVVVVVVLLQFPNLRQLLKELMLDLRVLYSSRIK